MIIRCGVLELIFPTLNFRLCAKVLRASFVTSLHPDPRKRGVDKQIARAKRMCLLGGRKCSIQPSEGKIDFGKSMPRLEGRWARCRRFTQFREGAIILATRVVCCRIFDQALEFIVSHDGKSYCVRHAEKRKDGLWGRPVNPPIESIVHSDSPGPWHRR